MTAGTALTSLPRVVSWDWEHWGYWEHGALPGAVRVGVHTQGVPNANGASASSTAYPTCFPLTQFTCNNGRCININWRCDNGEDPALWCSRGDGETRGGGAAWQGPHFGNLGQFSAEV